MMMAQFPTGWPVLKLQSSAEELACFLNVLRKLLPWASKQAAAQTKKNQQVEQKVGKIDPVVTVGLIGPQGFPVEEAAYQSDLWPLTKWPPKNNLSVVVVNLENED